jgi:hypothetical protein
VGWWHNDSLDGSNDYGNNNDDGGYWIILLLLFFLWNILGVEILFTNELNLKINYRILKKHRKILLKKYFI